MKSTLITITFDGDISEQERESMFTFLSHKLKLYNNVKVEFGSQVVKEERFLHMVEGEHEKVEYYIREFQDGSHEYFQKKYSRSWKRNDNCGGA